MKFSEAMQKLEENKKITINDEGWQEVHGYICLNDRREVVNKRGESYHITVAHDSYVMYDSRKEIPQGTSYLKELYKILVSNGGTGLSEHANYCRTSKGCTSCPLNNTNCYIIDEVAELFEELNKEYKLDK